MDHTNLENELRSVKRRRIEIRSTKAALDMEDFDLDDKQSTLEQLLHKRSNFTPARSIGHHNLQLNNAIKQQSSRSPHLTSQAGSDQSVLLSGGEGVSRDKLQQKNIPVDTITIDDEDDRDIALSSRRASREISQVKREQTHSRSQGGSRSVSSQAIRDNNDISLARPSKIVVLKVCFPKTLQPVSVSNRYMKPLIQNKSPSLKPDAPVKSQQNSKARTLHASLKPLNPRSEQQPSRIQEETSLQRLLQQVLPSLSKTIRKQTPITSLAISAETKARSNSPLITKPTNSDGVSQAKSPASPFSPRLQPELSKCPCKGRNRNCHTCRGTPAVIAEGHTLLSPSQAPSTSAYTSSTSPSGSHGRSTRTHGQRSASRPKSYRIDEFEEMEDPERAELEIKFCRRVVNALASMREIHGETIPWWAGRLRERGKVWDVFMGELKRLLQRKRIPREDENGDWNGAVMVTPCRNQDEFVIAVDNLLANITADHPQSCCMRESIVASTECWSIGFGRWFEVQMDRCGDCIEACDVALNLGEREDIVDDWEIG